MTEERKTESIYNIEYILSQIAKIQEQTEYLNDALEKLSQMGDGESGAPGSPGNIQGQAKAQAFADIVRCRETTNQKMLSLYEKMYDDLKPDNGTRSWMFLKNSHKSLQIPTTSQKNQICLLPFGKYAKKTSEINTFPLLRF